MTDKSLGTILLLFGLVGSAAYIYWLFAPAAETEPFFYIPYLRIRWAIVIPVLLLVLAVFFLAIWIGWTMVATPPPMVPFKKTRKNEDQK